MLIVLQLLKAAKESKAADGGAVNGRYSMNAQDTREKCPSNRGISSLTCSPMHHWFFQVRNLHATCA
ncbi:hypothetical protein KIN20_024317 [Parelaphostrongylus tenuis]|uniref:Uncharacterized protein n=1 Tax=Parelaphostrongylus tenuis TaxID=148309 RepID=A0AAD5N7G6_PARTN|nr:hypothetical protein KIN20_024317 [Parelaphostrongylus tenuis]